MNSRSATCPRGLLGEWLDKFERLLRRLYWLDAEVLLMPEGLGGCST